MFTIVNTTNSYLILKKKKNKEDHCVAEATVSRKRTVSTHNHINSYVILCLSVRIVLFRFRKNLIFHFSASPGLFVLTQKVKKVSLKCMCKGTHRKTCILSVQTLMSTKSYDFFLLQNLKIINIIRNKKFSNV